MIASFSRFATVSNDVVLSACLSLLCCTACSGAGGVEQPVAYVIPDATVPAFDLSSVGVPVEPFSWTFEDPDSLAEWQLVNTDRAGHIDAGALVVESSGNDPQMIRATDFDADRVMRIEFRVHAGDGENLKVYWARAREEFSELRAAVVPEGGGVVTDGGVRTLILPVSNHFEWRGRIRRLRIDPTHRPGESVRIAGIRARGFAPDADRILAAAGSARIVALHDDHRPALLAEVDAPLHRIVSAPRGGSLRFAYGLKCIQSAPPAQGRLRFEILANTPGGEAQSIFRRIIDAGPEADVTSHGGWRDGDAAIPAHEEVSLTFRVSSSNQQVARENGPIRSADSSAGVPCLAAWANPVVVAAPSDPAPFNVLLISIDTLRSDRISLYGNRHGLTPEIDAWARRRGTTFPNAIAAAPWTLPSHTSMFTGLDALSHGVNHGQPAPPHLHLLAERLRAAAYSTVAFTGGGYLDPRFGLAQGFDRFVTWTRDLAGEAELASNTERLVEWLRSSSTRPFFALFHTYEVHEPYRGRQPHFDELYSGPVAERIDEVARVPDGLEGDGVRLAWSSNPDAPADAELVELVNALYDSGVAHADAQIGRVLRELERLQLADDTIVILTSDHGETLGEEGFIGHARMSNETLVVPLIVAVPGLGGGSVHIDRVRSVDIVPTVLELIGLPFGGLDGDSLVPLLEGNPKPVATTWSYSARWGVAVRTPDDFEYVFDPVSWRPPGTQELFYRLISGAPDVRAPRARAAGDAVIREEVVDRLEAMPGLVVRFSNDRDRAFSVTLRLDGPLLSPLKVKTPRLPLPCDCLRWGPDRSLHVTVPPGTSFAIRLHGMGADELVVAGSTDTGRFEARFTPAEIDSQRSLSIGAPDARFVDGPLVGDAGVTLNRTGPTPGPAGTTIPVDPTLLRRLRALGYLR